jgi:hypothetical protein
LKIRALLDDLAEWLVEHRSSGPPPRINQQENECSILQPGHSIVVYQAAESIAFHAALAMNDGSISSDLIVARTDSTP